jgi:hypothetical protein
MKWKAAVQGHSRTLAQASFLWSERTILTDVRRLAGLASVGVLAMSTACGSSHHARLSMSDHRVGSHAYSGRLYSVRQVRGAFAALGLQLHRGDSRASDLALLVNNRRLGPQHITAPPRLVTVVVVTGRHAAASTASFAKRHHTRVTRYANVTAFSKGYVVDEVKAAISALRWGTVPNHAKPGRRLVVLGDSIGGIWLGESRRNVERAFGPGRSKQRGFVSYFGGHLLVNYWFHDGLYNRVQYLETRWGGYHTRSGVRVGSTREELRPLYVSCVSKAECSLQAGPMPDARGTIFTMRHDRVVEIDVGSF